MSSFGGSSFGGGGGGGGFANDYMGGGGGGGVAAANNFGGGNTFGAGAASAGAGGFFAKSEGTGGVGSPDKKAKRFRNMVPATVKQLLNCDLVEDTLMLDGHEVTQATIVGQIMKVVEHSTNITYAVDDGTGVIDVRVWIDSQDSEVVIQERSEWREGVYIRVYGQPRSFNNNRNLMAFRMRTVTDYNEVTYHLLDVVHSHLVMTKGPLDRKENTGAAPMNIANPTNAGPYGAYKAPVAAAAQFTQLQESVLKAIKSSNESQGVAVSDVVQSLSNFGSEQEIRKAVEWLAEEGHLYSTVDDEHFRSTD